MNHNFIKKLKRTEFGISLNAHRGTVDLALRSMTKEELWQLVLEIEAKVAAKLEHVEVDSSTLH